MYLRDNIMLTCNVHSWTIWNERSCSQLLPSSHTIIVARLQAIGISYVCLGLLRIKPSSETMPTPILLAEPSMPRTSMLLVHELRAFTFYTLPAL